MSFCLIYFRHCRKKFCYLGAYSNTKCFHQKRVLEILCKSKFCVCFEIHIPVDIFEKINPIRGGGGGGALWPPYRFFLCCIKTVSSRMMKLQTFSNYVLGIWKCIFDLPGTQFVAMATLLLRCVCRPFNWQNYKKSPIGNMISPSNR